MKSTILSKSLVLYGLMCVSSIDSYAQKLPMYIGTYTSGSKSEGVYVYDFDTKTGKAAFQQAIPMSNPSFLARRGHMLYAVNEDMQGKVTAYDLKQQKVVSELATGGAHPCHIAYSSSLPVLLVSNYTGGSLSLFSLEKNGAIRKQEQHIQFQSRSINTERQNAAHIHSAFFSKDGKRAYVSDLGADFIYEYALQKQGDAYSLQEISRIAVKKGGGPRHIAFGKGEQIIYSVLELTGEIEVLRKQQGTWTSQQVVPIYSSQFKGSQGAADIKVSKNGKYVYATNRGDANVIASYIVQADGKLALQDVASVAGNSPRNLNLSPNNKWLLVGNQESQQVSVFQVAKDGKLNITSAGFDLPKPVCVIF